MMLRNLFMRGNAMMSQKHLSIQNVGKISCFKFSSSTNEFQENVEPETLTQEEIDRMGAELEARIKKNQAKIHFKQSYVPGKEAETKDFVDKMVATLNMKQESMIEDLHHAFPPILEYLEKHEEYTRLPYVVERLMAKEVEGMEFKPPYGALHLVAANAFFDQKANDSKKDVNKEEKHRMAQALGWCAEVLISPSTLDEDPFDLQFMIDIPLAERATHYLIRMHFGDKPDLHSELCNHYHDVYITYASACSTEVAMNYAFNRFGAERISKVANYCDMKKKQNGTYTLYLPIAAAAILNGQGSMDNLIKLEDVCGQILLHSAVERDFKVVFPHLNNSGVEVMPEKIEIEDDGEGKERLNYFFLHAMELSEKSQKRTLQKHFGKDDEESVGAIKDIYRDLNLLYRLKMWEEEYYKKTSKKIEELPDEMPKEYLQAFLDMSEGKITKMINAGDPKAY